MVPDGAEAVGKESDGGILFLARAGLNGGLHPGKVRVAFGAANIAYGGKEVKVADYEVFVGKANWVAAANGDVPLNAKKAGHEADGTPLFVARAFYKGGLHPGKVRPGFKGANIPYGGKEVTVAQYEVLV